jgi:hypothetical protein
MLALRLTFLAAACLPLAHATTWGKESLKGLTVFSVSVILEPRCTQIFAADRIQTDAELKLRSAGIPLKQRAYLEDGGAALAVSVGCLPIIQGGRTTAWASDYTVSVTQGVNLTRTGTSVLAVTWSIDSILVGSIPVIENNLRGQIRDSIDEFLNDYFTVNPKK